ncbi:hypothetical protein NPS01_31180 [Nocardioides psychrotolerans]|uniref:Peptidase M10 metallopeptidase domain-containing protein n=1 Tax=Nocardioides psychrotolerans TaxID=1005945 RepID=A0A1I3MCD2_9ACTN|nr:matrixin family metalloprotease [Nocardioides psychrotolerans]GEP39455.1 hypothetical protein NPS01_31180 [Nocardioides psychrotolerans]SFI94774.1 hypothetical protein SAMN05216561_11549 [Nocardioides psychrotolerans]
MAGADNDCGRGHNVNRDANYAGITSLNPNIALNADGDVICSGNSDSISVVGFGKLPEGVLGVSCPKRSSLDSKELIVDDIRISQDSSTFTLTPNALGCVSRYDLQALVTHEFGHFFGLGHVSESKRQQMTMSPLVGACTAAERTLGLRDMLGLEVLF